MKKNNYNKKNNFSLIIVGYDDYKDILEHFVNFINFINNYFHESLKQEFEFLFGRWLNKDSDLKEPLSKFYRDIYEQVTDPHIYKPIMDKTEEESKEN